MTKAESPETTVQGAYTVAKRRRGEDCRAARTGWQSILHKLRGQETTGARTEQHMITVRASTADNVDAYMHTNRL